MSNKPVTLADPDRVGVILVREPYKHNVKYVHRGMASAYNRVMALCELHGCNYTLLDHVVLVNASETYKPRSK